MATIAERQVAHVWRRLGFGPTPADVTAGAATGPQHVIADLLSRQPTTPAQWGFTPNTGWQGDTLWLGQLFRNMEVGNPAQERMSWILRNLLVVGVADDTYTADVRQHLYRLRADPFGSYKQLLADITVLPAMMKYLTLCRNSKQHPNQNFARELCELFTLGRVHALTGEANYVEYDVQEIARALTGYVYNWNTHTIAFNPSYYDSGTKTIFGVNRGNIGLTGVLDVVAQHPAWSVHVPARLYRELVGLEPSAATVSALGAVWGSTGDIKAVVTAICNAPEFLADAAIGCKVKTPVELLVSAGRVLNVDLTTSDFSWQLRDLMGMHPMLPPNVGGWRAGTRWLNAGGLMTWNGIVQTLVASARNVSGSPVAVLASTSRPQAATEAARLTCITDLSSRTASAMQSFANAGSWNLDRAAGVLALALTSPEFHVN